MRIFETESIWDSENNKWVESFYIDGNEVEIEEYYSEQEKETEILDEECEEDCYDCGYCDDDSLQEEARIITDCLNFVFSDEVSCLDCKAERIIDTIYLFKNLGYTEAKDTFRDFLDNLD